MDINSENDKRVAKLEKKLRAVYLQAQSDVQAKMEDYLQRFAVKDAIKQEQVKQGKISQEEYIKWREGQIAVGKLWQDMVDALAADYTNANQIAVGMICGEMSGIFAENHNYAAYEIEHDTMLNLSFSLYDKNTLMNMVVNDPNMLPLPSVNIPKDLRWNKQKINSVITQAILQGDGIPKIAQNLRKVTDMNYTSAVRNARTSMTAAQNAGRVESYKHAQDMGIDLQQEWLATLDGRTRHSHRRMDGEKIAVAKDKWHPAKFSNGCRYPGDPQGPPWEIYNCRCTLVAAIKGIDQSNAPRNSKLGDMSYEEWKNEHKPKPTIPTPPTPAPVHMQGIRAVLGDGYANAMETLLEFTDEPNVKDLYYKYGDRFGVVNDPDRKGGAFFMPSEGKVHMNAEYISKGDDLHLPYQTAFHEFGHDIDWLAGHDAGGQWISVAYGDNKLNKAIVQDYYNFAVKTAMEDLLHTEDGEDYFRMGLRDMDKGDGVYVDLSRKLRRKEITIDDILSRPDADEIMSGIIAQSYGGTTLDSLVINKLKNENMPLSTRGNISDILESVTHTKYPLGAGHGTDYWGYWEYNTSGTPEFKSNDNAAIEFFAEVCDSMVANPESLAQMWRIFPNAVGVVKEIMEELTK